MQNFRKNPPSARCRNLFFVLTVFLWLSLNSLHADVVYPIDTVIDITQAPYNADPTGVVDSTAAIQSAMDNFDGNSQIWRQRYILYFPNGTYRLSGSLRLDTHDSANGGSGRGIIFQGESREGVLLKLDDAAAGFDDPEDPQVVVDFNEANDIIGVVWQFVGFQIHIKDLSIDVGSGNPGAIGLDFAANNCGGIENVSIRSSDPAKAGHTGLLLSKLPGPHFNRNIEVDGFDYGIRTDGITPNYTVTMEDITIRNSLINGVQNNTVSMSIHRLRMENIGQVAIQNNTLTPYTPFLLIADGEFSGGNNEYPAVENNGFIYVRNIRMNGYANLLSDHLEGEFPGPRLSEWYSGSAETLFPTDPVKSLYLPVEDPPNGDRDPIEEWVSVLDFGAERNNDSSGASVATTVDDAPAFQAALDSMAPGAINDGKRTIYFPAGQYIFKSGVTIPPYVERVVGCFSSIQPLAGAKDSVASFTIASGSANPIVIEQLTSDWSDGRIGEDTAGTDDFRRATPFIKNESTRTVVLKDIWVTSGQVYKNTASEGKLFIENVSGTSSRYGGIAIAEPLPSAVPQFDFGGQDVWARQLNAEQKNMNALSDGGDVWILGIKDEEDGTFMKTINGGRAEILGGIIMPLDVDSQEQPAFELIDSAMTIVVPTHTRSSGKKKPGGLFTGFYDTFYDVMVRETQGDETRDLLTEDLVQDRGYYTISPKVLPLFRGSIYSAAENWRLNYFGTFEDNGEAADSADPDGDLLTNFEERALGRDPLDADMISPYTSEVIEVDGLPYLALTYNQLTGGTGTAGIDYTASGIEYSVQYKSQLTDTWEGGLAAPLTLVTEPVDTGNGVETVTVRTTDSIELGSESHMMRVKIAESP